QLAQSDTAQLELAVVTARTAADFATVAHAHLRRIARQLGELQAGCEALIERQVLVLHNRLEGSTLGSILLGHLGAAVVLFNRAGLGHLLGPFLFPGAYWRNGKLNAFSSARASSSVVAVVQMIMSMPQIWSTWS